VLDASALLCLFFDEPGADRVEAFLAGARVGAANLAEVTAKLVDRGVDGEAIAAVKHDEHTRPSCVLFDSCHDGFEPRQQLGGWQPDQYHGGRWPTPAEEHQRAEICVERD
jgi:hypothetical protein